MGTVLKRVAVREQAPEIRKNNFKEVCLGYNLAEASSEAERCLNCKKPRCVEACPVSIDIPGFINQIRLGNISQAAGIINQDSSLPAVCGRVCPQESQCEGACILNKKGEAISIGKLERFTADWSRENNICFTDKEENKGFKVAIIGSGPAGLACASDLAKKGYEVSIFEALHKAGGVLEYGIPEFRLPKAVVRHEINNLKMLGVKIETDVIIGQTLSIDQLMGEEGFSAVFVGSGAGLPKFMNIKGENLNGVLAANEFLTRTNLMQAYEADSDTPIYVGTHVVVVGGGNVAMDAARCAVRMGAKVSIVYRRGEDELPARKEEVHHAKEEGIEFVFLANPTEIKGNEHGWVSAISCIRMGLGEPDASGRRKPIEIPGSEFVIDCDMVIMSLGTSPNPLIINTTPGLKAERWGGIVIDEQTAHTQREGVFAGGDAVTGAATVILAMGAGRKAASAIHQYINNSFATQKLSPAPDLLE